jgi:hypothetical protein
VNIIGSAIELPNAQLLSDAAAVISFYFAFFYGNPDRSSNKTAPRSKLLAAKKYVSIVASVTICQQTDRKVNPPSLHRPSTTWHSFSR